MTGAVRPLRSRLVRASAAPGLVAPMVESLDVPPETSPADPASYGEPGAALYVYRQQRGLEAWVGLVCDVHPAAFRDGRVRGHESVIPERVEALVRHLGTEPSSVEPVALLHRPGPRYTETLAACLTNEPAIDLEGPDGLRQSVWRVPPGAVSERLTTELGGATHYVADGHHRVAANLAVWTAADEPADAGIPCVVYPMDGLRLSAFNRRVTGPVDPGRLRAHLAGFAGAAAQGPPRGSGCFGAYVDGGWLACDFAGVRSSGVSGLDAALLHDLVLAPLVDDPARILPVKGPLAQLVAATDADAGALFTLLPPSLDVLTGLADRGEVMPQKTTYFQPKPYAGIFLRA